MDIFSNIEQFTSLGLIVLLVAVFAELVLGTIILRSKLRSATNIIFFFLCIFTSLWLIAAFVVHLEEFYPYAVLLARLGIFFAAPVSALFLLLAHTIPSEHIRMKPWVFWLVVVSTAVMMGINISPYAFTADTKIIDGTIHPVPGPGLIPFAVLSTLFSVLAIYFLIKKFRRAEGNERLQMKLVLSGMLIMLILVTCTILIPILVFGSGMFVILTPIYTLVFLGMTAYAIVRYGLFELKVIATEGLTAVIAIILFSNIFVAGTLVGTAIAALVFIATSALGIILIGSVRREVRQREELQRLTAQLTDANKKLEDLSRFKTQLLSLASHQIRSPLAAIKGLVSLVAGGAYGPIEDKTKEALTKVKSSTDELINLINVLLDLRKVDEGKMEYQFVRTDLAKIVGEVVDLMRTVAEAKKLEFTYESPGHEIPVNADSEKLKQVIQNLVDNAIKYTPSGFVKVQIKVVDATVAVTVSDSGVGFPASLTPYLFEEFVRDERIKQQIRGTGLGLYIARKITEAHGGKITAGSDGEGKGSTFRLTLPTLKNV